MKNYQEKNLKKSIKPGTIWQLGDHRLAYGSSTDKQLVEKLLCGEKVNLICTDPPYGVGVVESKRGFQELSKDKIITNDHLQSHEEYKKFSSEWLKAVAPHLTPYNSCYIFNADKMIWALREGMDSTDFKVAQLLIWVKSQSVVGRLDYAPQHELIVYGWYGKHKFKRPKDKSVLFHKRPSKSKLHPTTKPIGLIRRLILNSTDMGDAVFDGFLGSGTTLLACEQLKRKCYAVELDSEYCLTTIRQWEKLTGLKAKQL